MAAGGHSANVQAVRPRRLSERSRARSKSREPASQQSPSRRRDPLAPITNNKSTPGAEAASTSPGKYEEAGGEVANADTGYGDVQETVWGGAGRHEGAVLRFPLQLRGRDEDEAARRKRTRGGDDENLVVPLRCAKKLLSSSFLATFSVVMAYMNEQYDCAALATSVLVCSILYWSYPTFGLRRNIDIFFACFSVNYQLIFKAPQLYESGQTAQLCAFLALTAAGISCYLLARYTGAVLRNQDAACLWHVGLHVIGNLSNAVLYTSLGRIARASA